MQNNDLAETPSWSLRKKLETTDNSTFPSEESDSLFKNIHSLCSPNQNTAFQNDKQLCETAFGINPVGREESYEK
jgi:hypothetical protein